MIDLKKLWEAMPRDVQRKISCHDLKRIADNYNGPCSAEQIIRALKDALINLRNASLNYKMDKDDLEIEDANAALAAVSESQRKAAESAD